MKEPILLIKESQYKKINPETGVPITNNGQVIYERIPTRKCDLHGNGQQNFFDNLWDMFKFNN